MDPAVCDGFSIVCIFRMNETWLGCTYKFNVEFLFVVQKYDRPQNDDGREMVVIRLTFVDV